MADTLYDIAENLREQILSSSDRVQTASDFFTSYGHDIRKEDIVINQTDVIELTWSYKGNIYRSKAIASHDHGLIYDNISTYASTPNSCVDDA